MNKNTAVVRYLISVAIYGTIGLFLHYIDAKSEFVVLCRGIIGSVFILLVLMKRKQNIDYATIKNNLLLLIVSGICLGLNWVFLFAGYSHAIALTSLCNYTAPIIIVIISALFINEKPNNKQKLCIGFAFLGIILVSGVFDAKGTVNIASIICGFLAALGFTGLVLCNRNLKQIAPLEKTFVQLFISALTVFPYVLLHKGFPNSLDFLSVLLLLVLGIFHTGIAYILYFGSIDTIPVQSVAILGYVEPVLSVLIGALIFKEKLSAYGIVGAILILSSSLCNELFASK